MPRNKTEDLKNHLFQVLEELNNPEKGTDFNKTIQKAKAVASIGTVINNTYKNEIDVIKLVDKFGLKKSDFPMLNAPEEKEQKS